MLSKNYKSTALERTNINSSIDELVVMILINYFIKAGILSVLLILFSTLTVYLPSASNSWWISDDHTNIYYPERGENMPSFNRQIDRADGVVRLLMHPYKTTVGSSLGNYWSHVYCVIKHIVCSLVLFYILLKLSFSKHASTLGAMFFALAPWAVQPVVWWTASQYIEHTVLFLLGILLFLKYLPSDGYQKWFLILGYFLVMLCSLMIYELWLFGIVTLIGVYIYRHFSSSEEISWRGFYKESKCNMLQHVLVSLLPFLIWFIAYILTKDSSDKYSPDVGLLRIFVVFLSIHLRTYHWFADTPWLNAMKHGFASLGDPLALCLFIMFCLSILGMAWQWRRGGWEKIDDLGMNQKQLRCRLIAGLLLAWSFFLGSRLVFILQGGVALHTRHSYGAAIAVGVFVCVVLDYLIRSRSRWLKPCLGALSMCIFIMVFTTAGLAHHTAKTARTEKYAWEYLTEELTPQDADKKLVITGDATGTKGELPFFEQGNGQWLEVLLKRSLGVNFDVLVAPEGRLQGNEIQVTTYAGDEIMIDASEANWYRWIQVEDQHRLRPADS